MAESARRDRKRPARWRTIAQWASIAVSLVLGVVLTIAAARHGPALPHSSVTLPWYGAVLLFIIFEQITITLPLRSSRPAVTISEGVLAVALCLSSPLAIILGMTCGAFVKACTDYRMTNLYRIASNSADTLLYAALADLTFHWLVGSSALDLQTWLAVLVATLVFSAAVLSALEGLWLSTGQVTWGVVRESLSLTMVTSVVSASLGILCVVMVLADPHELLLLVLPTLALWLMYRSYSGERQQREAVEFLHGADDALHRGSELESAILSVLVSARSAFRAEIAQLTVFPSDGEGLSFRTTVRQGMPDEVMEPVPLDQLDYPMTLGHNGQLVERVGGSDAIVALLASRNVDDAMVAELRGVDRALGSLLIGGHTLLKLDRYNDRDLQLFRTLATQTSNVLESNHTEQAVASLNALQDRLEHQAIHDSLTGLGNRASFSDRVTETLKSDSRTGVLFIDIDDFKTVNESLGYASGDDLLIEASHRLTLCLRQNDTAARWDGDEFAVLVPDLDDDDELDAIAQRVLLAFKGSPVRLGAESLRMHASIGMATCAGGELLSADLLRHADVAMHAAKAAGKDCSVLYVDGMDSAVVTRHQLRSELEIAIDDNQLLVYYQPVVNLDDADIMGAEALIRWRHPTRGIVGPGEFIPLAEESGLIITMGAYVLREACRQWADWAKRFPHNPPRYVSVNASGRQLQQPNFIEDVFAIVEDTGIDPKALVIELTETILLDDSATILQKLESLRKGGIRIALDDFGTGYSSLGYLRRLPIDILKIDKAFVDDLGSDQSAGDFARAVVGIGSALKLAMIAEGIEETPQVERLRQMGCTRGQGFLMARPQPASDIERLLSGPGIDRALLGGDWAADQIIPLRRPPA